MTREVDFQKVLDPDHRDQAESIKGKYLDRSKFPKLSIRETGDISGYNNFWYVKSGEYLVEAANDSSGCDRVNGYSLKILNMNPTGQDKRFLG